MSKFVISASEYMEESYMYSKEAKSKIDIIKGLMGRDEYDSDEEWAEDCGLAEGYSDDDIMSEWNDNVNGDGMPYYMIFDVEKNEMI